MPPYKVTRAALEGAGWIPPDKAAFIAREYRELLEEVNRLRQQAASAESASAPSEGAAGAKENGKGGGGKEDEAYEDKMLVAESDEQLSSYILWCTSRLLDKERKKRGYKEPFTMDVTTANLLLEEKQALFAGIRALNAILGFEDKANGQISLKGLFNREMNIYNGILLLSRGTNFAAGRLAKSQFKQVTTTQEYRLPGSGAEDEKAPGWLDALFKKKKGKAVSMEEFDRRVMQDIVG